MNKRYSNRPFRGHGSIEDEFVFEEVSMDDSPRREAPQKNTQKRGELKKVQKVKDTATLDDKDIDAMVADFVSAQPKIKSSRRSRKGTEAHIASNPSVNPMQAKTVMVDGVKTANTRIHQSVEEEMKSRGIKKLPNGISAADLAIPSYDSVVTATERRPLDCALHHEFQDGQLSPLEEMMRKSAERSGKGKQTEKSEKKDSNKKKGGKQELKSEQKSDAKLEKKSDKKQEKKPEKATNVLTNGQSDRENNRKSAKKSKNPQRTQDVVTSATPATVSGTDSGTMPTPAVTPSVSLSVSPSPSPVVSMSAPPQFYQLPGTASVMDASMRTELLKQQEMLLNMIHQCHQTLAAIQAQLLTSPTSYVPVQPVSIVPVVPPVFPEKTDLNQDVPKTGEPSNSPESTMDSEVESAQEADTLPRRKPSRRERQRIKKQRELGKPEENENVVSEDLDVTSESVSEASGTPERAEMFTEKETNRKARKNKGEGVEKREEKATEKVTKKATQYTEQYTDPVMESPEDFVTLSNEPEPKVAEDFDNLEAVTGKKKEKKGVFSQKKEAESLKSQKPEKKGKVEKYEKSEKSEKTPKNQKRDERLRQLNEGEFGKMGLSRELLLALDDAQYATPSRIQKEFIPEALTGEDVMGQAQTGTGKTAAFAIPILQTVKFDEDSFDPQALVLVPTRELAVQVRDVFEKLAKYTDLEILALYGGKPLPPQVQQLREGVDIIVGTPGRIMDHIKRGSLRLRNLKIIVLDEADRMLDIGFRPDIEKILRVAPQSRQTLLLSATIPQSVESIARKYMRDPKVLDCSLKDISSETIEQFYFTVDPELKFDLLLKLLERENPKQAIIFCRTKRGVEKVAHRLSHLVQSVESIHGDLQQRRRDRVMSSFRAGKTRYLVATDVVGRGIDVSGISHIINYDIPKFCDDYVHRVGRTGRMGHEGVAFTFVAPEEGNELTRIEMRINQLLKRDEVAGFASIPAMSNDSMEKPADDIPAVKESIPPRRKRRL